MLKTKTLYYMLLLFFFSCGTTKTATVLVNQEKKNNVSVNFYCSNGELIELQTNKEGKVTIQKKYVNLVERKLDSIGFIYTYEDTDTCIYEDVNKTVTQYEEPFILKANFKKVVGEIKVNNAPLHTGRVLIKPGNRAEEISDGRFKFDAFSAEEYVFEFTIQNDTLYPDTILIDSLKDICNVKSVHYLKTKGLVAVANLIKDAQKKSALSDTALKVIRKQIDDIDNPLSPKYLISNEHIKSLLNSFDNEISSLRKELDSLQDELKKEEEKELAKYYAFNPKSLTKSAKKVNANYDNELNKIHKTGNLVEVLLKNPLLLDNLTFFNPGIYKINESGKNELEAFLDDLKNSEQFKFLEAYRSNEEIIFINIHGYADPDTYYNDSIESTYNNMLSDIKTKYPRLSIEEIKNCYDNDKNNYYLSGCRTINVLSYIVEKLNKDGYSFKCEVFIHGKCNSSERKAALRVEITPESIKKSCNE